MIVLPKLLNTCKVITVPEVGNKMTNMILTPALRDFVMLSDEEKTELPGLRRTQYYYRLRSRISQAIEDLETIIDRSPKELPVDFLLTLLQRRLRVQHPKEGLVIRIEFQRPSQNY